ncbi:MAG: hypothetical protein JWQ21_3026 [Herminiimonas sp.]|nr:hypothetical protein [Herminiimonas sp.]
MYLKTIAKKWLPPEPVNQLKPLLRCGIYFQTIIQTGRLPVPMLQERIR